MKGNFALSITICIFRHENLLQSSLPTPEHLSVNLRFAFLHLAQLQPYLQGTLTSSQLLKSRCSQNVALILH